jgi:hypothetical protein
MDDLMFDRLTKILGGAGTRRAVNRLLAGGGIGALLGRTGLAPALAGERDDDCKKKGKCRTDKACCSGKCRDGRCKPKSGGANTKGGCDPKKYYCFKSRADFSQGRPISLQDRVEVPTCWSWLPPPEGGCQPGHGKCPRTPCQACNQRFPQQCQGKCHAADHPQYDPTLRNRLQC